MQREMMVTQPNGIGFALGGLAGNNAHGAGFLQAALDTRVTPEMISCTSGQLLWVWYYLRLSIMTTRCPVMERWRCASRTNSTNSARLP